MDNTRTVDVAILGGGLAGNLLARQLRRQCPDLSVALFERTTEGSWKVGESTVEIACNYFIRRLGLTKYLYENQLPKNGLRFYFDTPEKNTSLFDMTEIGSRHLLRLPTFQLDRARFDSDLQAMNRADGVDLHLGARVHDLQMGGGPDAHHAFTVTEGDTLWDIAADVAPAGEVADMVVHLEQLNHMDSAALQAGQRLLVPVASR